ncbi:MAG TPA: cobalamin biosynthesis protein, partial [Desulfobulbaceae bacterium]|nr:cobalamin biosynthesis protein [Desulfobulbaceae bacterium]
MEGFFNYYFAGGFPLAAQTLLPGLWLALALDLLLGDPRRLPHPVMLIGGLAKGFESIFRNKNFSQNMHLSRRRAGQLTVGTTLVGVCACIALLLFLFGLVSPLLLFAGSVLLLYTTIALRSMVEHALTVYHALPVDKETATDAMLGPARRKVGLIVGRDTNHLSYEGIVRACVESVAENMSDGVIAPVFYAIVGAGVSVA